MDVAAVDFSAVLGAHCSVLTAGEWALGLRQMGDGDGVCCATRWD